MLTLSQVTISQLNSAVQSLSEDSFRVDRKELQQISFVGLIIRVQQTETVMVYEIDDGTGTIIVKYWLEKDAPPPPRWSEGSYVRVVGHLRSFSDERNVVADKLMDVPDMNELTYHQLEVLAIHLAATRGPAAAAGSAVSSSHLPLAPVQGLVSNATDPSQIIYAIIAQSQDAAGPSKAAIIAQCRSQFSEAVISSTIDSLIQEGHIYPSIDDYHFKSADS